MGRTPLRRRHLMVGLIFVATAAAVAAMAPAAASAAPSRHDIAGSVPQWLGQARSVGDTPSGEKVRFGVLLGMRNAGTAVSTLADISDPSSAHYGNWLTGAQFRSQYSPSASDVSAVRTWLTGQGFQVDSTLPSGMYVEASGTTAQIEKSFATTVKNYSYRGRTVRANSSVLSFPADTPAAVTGVVAGVLGVDQGSQLHRPATTEPGPPAGALRRPALLGLLRPEGGGRQAGRVRQDPAVCRLRVRAAAVPVGLR